MQDVLGKGPLELAPVGKDNEYMAIGEHHDTLYCLFDGRD
jgi:hypothetical protein